MTLAQRTMSVTQTRVSVSVSKMLKGESAIIVNSITTVSILDKDVRHVTVIQLALSI